MSFVDFKKLLISVNLLNLIFLVIYMSNINFFRNIFIKNTILCKKKLFKYSVMQSLRNYSASESKRETKNNVIRHNFHAECEEGINHQINQEFCVSYVYLYMSTLFSRFDIALHGFSKYFREAAGEEIQHARKLIEFLNKRGGQLELKNIIAPEKKDWSNPVCAVQCAIDLEKQVTQSLEALHERGGKHNDHHLCDFIETYYLEEQYEDIKKLGDLLTNIKRAAPGLGVIMIDMELQRPKSKIFGLHDKESDLQAKDYNKQFKLEN